MATDCTLHFPTFHGGVEGDFLHLLQTPALHLHMLTVFAPCRENECGRKEAALHESTGGPQQCGSPLYGPWGCGG